MKKIMKKMIAVITTIFALSGCSLFSSLTSNTIISPNNSFVLGNNEHGSFKVKLKNVSANDLEVYEAPIDGGKHSGQTVKPGQTVTVSVDRNTALIINNSNKDTASVDLKVTGDVGLSMGYKNQ
jgi:Prokaryotic membrane lipoprotein lipid attachment site